MRNQPKERADSPWGQTQSVKEYGPGIVFVGTSSHGGMWLDEENCRLVKRLFPNFRPYAGYPWFEEDEDTNVAIAAMCMTHKLCWSHDEDVQRQVSFYMALKHCCGEKTTPIPVVWREWMREFLTIHGREWLAGGGGTYPQGAWTTRYHTLDGRGEGEIISREPSNGLENNYGFPPSYLADPAGWCAAHAGHEWIERGASPVLIDENGVSEEMVAAAEQECQKGRAV